MRMPLSPKVRENSSIIYQQIDFDTSDEGVEVLMMYQARKYCALPSSSLLMHFQSVAWTIFSPFRAPRTHHLHLTSPSNGKLLHTSPCKLLRWTNLIRSCTSLRRCENYVFLTKHAITRHRGFLVQTCASRHAISGQIPPSRPRSGYPPGRCRPANRLELPIAGCRKCYRSGV